MLPLNLLSSIFIEFEHGHVLFCDSGDVSVKKRDKDLPCGRSSAEINNKLSTNKLNVGRQISVLKEEKD